MHITGGPSLPPSASATAVRNFLDGTHFFPTPPYSKFRHGGRAKLEMRVEPDCSWGQVVQNFHHGYSVGNAPLSTRARRTHPR
jgi:hypothetical protein